MFWVRFWQSVLPLKPLNTDRVTGATPRRQDPVSGVLPEMLKGLVVTEFVACLSPEGDLPFSMAFASPD